MRCQNCNSENKYTDKYCKTCGKELSNLININNQSTQNKDSLKKIVIFFLILPFVLPIIISAFSIGITTYNLYLESSKALENIKETTGNLTSYTKCDYTTGGNNCYGVYSYTVNGVEYVIEGNTITNKEYLDKELTVYYNKENPSESTITFEYDNFLTKIFLIATIIAFGIGGIGIFAIYKIIKGPKKKTVKIDEIGNQPIKV